MFHSSEMPSLGLSPSAFIQEKLSVWSLKLLAYLVLVTGFDATGLLHMSLIRKLFRPNSTVCSLCILSSNKENELNKYHQDYVASGTFVLHSLMMRNDATSVADRKATDSPNDSGESDVRRFNEVKCEECCTFQVNVTRSV